MISKGLGGGGGGGGGWGEGLARGLVPPPDPKTHKILCPPFDARKKKIFFFLN